MEKPKLPYLPDNRQIKYRPASDFFMSSAKMAAIELSSDQMQPTGAVVVKDGKIIGRGANGSSLPGRFLRKLHGKGWCVRKFFGIKSGTKYWLCPGCAGFGSHAERRAIENAKSDTADLVGTDLYLWGHWWCCKSCWDFMILAGIRDVYLLLDSHKLFHPQSAQNILGGRHGK